MAAPAHHAMLPLAFRWLVIPAAVWSAVAATAIVLKRRAQKPTLQHMSDEWLTGRMYDRSAPGE
jgi:hypothetical protein